ncbi:hypothetical protein [Mucisphaera sp.]|uniref:hypothetical protein n=1 Tax=Mucisphaera sp. TaxID=2913024 RepID=UPI003D14A5EE
MLPVTPRPEDQAKPMIPERSEQLIAQLDALVPESTAQSSVQGEFGVRAIADYIQSKRISAWGMNSSGPQI